MTTRPCPLEHRDTAAPDLDPDRYVCRGCTGRLRGLLTDLAGLMDDLDTALARQARFAREANVHRRGAEEPLPFAVGPSEAGYVARATILVWVDWVTAVRGHTTPRTWRTVGEYLHDATDWIAAHPDGPNAVDELTAALRQARWAIDRPADRRYLGLCQGHRTDGTPCRQALFARDDQTTVECRRCHHPWPVDELLAELRARIEDHELPAADAARLLTEVGVRVDVNTIRQWKRRGQIQSTGDTIDGRPLYRIGDILDRALEGTRA